MARIKVSRWMRDLRSALQSSGVEVILAALYVYDVRQVILPGLRWDPGLLRLIVANNGWRRTWRPSRIMVMGPAGGSYR